MSGNINFHYLEKSQGDLYCSFPYALMDFHELSSKQDIKRPIDELENLVENLDIEHAIRVEICSCIWKDQLKDDTISIKNGCKWLLDIIVKNYTVLNSKLKNQNAQSKRNISIQSVLLDSPSRLSIHSIVFKSIKELVLKWEDAEDKSRPFI